MMLGMPWRSEGRVGQCLMKFSREEGMLTEKTVGVCLRESRTVDGVLW